MAFFLKINLYKSSFHWFKNSLQIVKESDDHERCWHHTSEHWKTNYWRSVCMTSMIMLYKIWISIQGVNKIDGAHGTHRHSGALWGPSDKRSDKRGKHTVLTDSIILLSCLATQFWCPLSPARHTSPRNHLILSMVQLSSYKIVYIRNFKEK